MTADREDWDEFKRKVNRHLRHFRRRLPRGMMYRLEKGGKFLLAEFLAVFAFLGFLALAVTIKLDWNQVVSILIADIPVGIILYFVLERGSARKRHVLDVIDLYSARSKLSHLEIHRSDPWDFAEYPEEHYYIVNKDTKKSYFVTKPVHDLVREGLIRVEDKHRDFGELVRWLDHNGIEHPTDFPKGDELGF